MTLLRRPLFWMIAAEVVVVLLLLAAAWHLYDTYRRAAHPPAPASVQPVLGGAGAAPVAPAPARSPAPKPSPSALAGSGLGLDIDQLNSDAAEWERQQARLVSALTSALRNYLETVVLPAVERAERVRPAISPASTQSPAAIRNTP